MFDNTRQYEMLVRPLGRKQADEYYHDGAIWIEGREGNSYTIELKNHSGRRSLFVLSVDGLDVLEGKPAGLTSQGYIVDGNSSISIPGWKLNEQQAAEFFFSRKSDSYVNSIGGSTSNTGVIGAMVFKEKVVLSSSNIARYYSGNNDMDIASSGRTWQSTILQNMRDAETKTSGGIPSNTYTSPSVSTTVNDLSYSVGTLSNAATSYVSQDVGTGFGNATDWQTAATTFQRNNPNQPDCILAVYYNTAKNLEKMGIRLRTRRDVSYKADPFPAYNTATVGCKTPPGWQG